MPTTLLDSRVAVLERVGQSTKHRCLVGAEDSLLTLVQHEGSGVVFARHGDHGVAVVGHRAALVHRVACDSGGGVAGPVERVPAAVVGQALHRPDVCGAAEEAGRRQRDKGGGGWGGSQSKTSYKSQK